MLFNNREARLALANPDPALPRVPPSQYDTERPEETIQSIAKVLEELAQAPPPDPSVVQSTTTYPTKDDTTRRILLFRPADLPADQALPLLVWYHGGGGCLGSPEQSIPFCRRLANDHKVAVAAPSYRLSPKHKFPAQYEDSWAALTHIVSGRDPAFAACNFDAESGGGFLLGGESYGAHLSVTLALQARDDGLRRSITGLFLAAGGYVPQKLADKVLSPQQLGLYLSSTQPECVNSPMLSRDASTCFAACRKDDDASPFARALNWTAYPGCQGKGFTGLPRAYFQACGSDILRDDTFILEDLFSDQGVETKLDTYPGCPHCFWVMFGGTVPGARWKQDTTKGINWLLKRL